MDQTSTQQITPTISPTPLASDTSVHQEQISPTTKKYNKKIYLSLALAILAIVGVGATLASLNQNTDTRSRAATSTIPPILTVSSPINANINTVFSSQAIGQDSVGGDSSLTMITSPLPVGLSFASIDGSTNRCISSTIAPSSNPTPTQTSSSKPIKGFGALNQEVLGATTNPTPVSSAATSSTNQTDPVIYSITPLNPKINDTVIVSGRNFMLLGSDPSTFHIYLSMPSGGVYELASVNPYLNNTQWAESTVMFKITDSIYRTGNVILTRDNRNTSFGNFVMNQSGQQTSSATSSATPTPTPTQVSSSNTTSRATSSASGVAKLNCILSGSIATLGNYQITVSLRNSFTGLTTQKTIDLSVTRPTPIEPTVNPLPPIKSRGKIIPIPTVPVN